MKKNIILTTLTVMIFIAFACSNSAPKAEQTDMQTQEMAHAYYTCPMHPEVHSHEPGKCPSCGMDLVMAEMAEPGSDQNQPSMEGMEGMEQN